MNLQILLVSPDPAEYEHLRESLIQLGNRCEPAVGYEYAVPAWQQHRHDIVIAECPVAGTADGWEQLLALPQAQPGMRLFIFLAKPKVAQLCNFANLGVSGLFLKPVDFRSLVVRLEQVREQLVNAREAEAQHARLAMGYAKLKQAYDDLAARQPRAASA